MYFIHLPKSVVVKQSLFFLVGAVTFWSCFSVKQSSALALDFTPSGLQNGSIKGAFFQEVSNNAAAGSGVIKPFLRIQSNKTTERGYNTDGALEFDTKAGIHTHSIELNDIATETLSGRANAHLSLHLS